MCTGACDVIIIEFAMYFSHVQGIIQPNKNGLNLFFFLKQGNCE